jgi:hypothetical protein
MENTKLIVEKIKVKTFTFSEGSGSYALIMLK